MTTNRITANIDFTALLRRFTIVRYYIPPSSGKRHYVGFNARILDKIKETDVFGVAYERGPSFFALMPAGVAPVVDRKLKKVEPNESYMYQKEVIKSAKDLEPHLLLQLLFNSIPALRNSRHQNNILNLTGGLYYVDSAKANTASFPALKLKINSDMTLNMAVTTFTKKEVALREVWRNKKEERKVLKMAEYNFSGSLMKRIFTNSSNAGNFVIKGRSGKKNDWVFLDISNWASFRVSKLGILYRIERDFQDIFQDVASIEYEALNLKAQKIHHSFIDLPTKKSLETYKEQFMKGGTFTLVDDVKSDESKEMAQMISKYLGVKLIPEGDYIIHIVPPAKKEDDPYFDTLGKNEVSQHIIAGSKVSKTVIENILSELHIKSDIKNNKCTTKGGPFPAASYLIIERETIDDFNQAGKLIVKTIDVAIHELKFEESGEFRYLEHSNGTSYFNGFIKYFDNSRVEGVIVHEGNVMAIENENRYIRWDTAELNRQLKAQEEGESEEIKTNDVIDVLRKMASSTGYKIDEAIASIKEKGGSITGKDLYQTIRLPISAKKEFVKWIQREKGITLRVYLKSAEQLQKLVGNQKGVTFFKEDEFNGSYIVADNKAAKSQFKRAWGVRSVKALEGKLSFLPFLDLMAVDFVRNKQLTVRPFPFKYLDEAINHKKKLFQAGIRN